MIYRVFETRAFLRDFAALDRSVGERVRAKLQGTIYQALRVQPHYGPNIRRLRSWVPPTWRYRVGAWRIFYEVDEAARLVLMTALEHRRDAYD